MASDDNGKTPDSPAPAVKTITAPRIMLFDQIKANARVTRMVLHQAGCQEVDYFATTKECVEEHVNKPYQVILVDFPALEGPHCKLARFLRRQAEAKDADSPHTQSLHIVAILTLGSKEMIKAAVMAGANAIWVKPLAPSSVQKRMATILDMLSKYGGPADVDTTSLVEKIDKF